jgi:hypothetical protein
MYHSFIYLDETDFFPPGQQQDARDVSERYIGMSNPWITMVSTPNVPEVCSRGLSKNQCLCASTKGYFSITPMGVGKKYTQDEIHAAESPSFERDIISNT